MKKKILTLLVLTLFVNLIFSQKNSFENVNEELKSQLIYYEVDDAIRTTSHRQSNGTTKTSEYRVISVRYHKGINGEIMGLDKKGLALKELIKSDKIASAELAKSLNPSCRL